MVTGEDECSERSVRGAPRRSAWEPNRAQKHLDLYLSATHQSLDGTTAIPAPAARRPRLPGETSDRLLLAYK